MIVDIEKVSAILREVAAVEVLPKFRKLAEHEIGTKDRGEVVTVADVAAERQISRRLRDLLPGSLVVGEESTADEPGLLDKFAEEDGWIWVIDPIDGTANFASGKPIFALMVALVRQGEAEAAWILDPIGPRCATAERGAGAWLDAARLMLGSPPPPDRLRGTLHATTFATADMARQIQSRRERVGAIKSLRCAGWDYLRLATGETQFALFTKLMPWDHLPGTLIFREAGGLANTFDGTPYGARDYLAPGLLMAPDQASWDWLHHQLLGAEEPA